MKKNKTFTTLKKEKIIDKVKTYSSHSKDSEIDESEEVNIEPKESYSDFLIKMLEETPKKKKNITSQISTYNRNKNYLLKNKISNIIYNPYNTSYNKSFKDSSFSKEQSLKNINERNKKFSQLNYTTNNKFINNDKNELKSQIKIPINTENQFLYTQFNKNFKKKYKSFELKNLIKNNTNPNLNINKSSNTNINSNYISKSILLNKYNKNFFDNKDNKSIKNNLSLNKLNKMRLNALYGYDKKFIKLKSHLSKKINQIDLKNYQNKILKVSKKNLSKNHLLKLLCELQSIQKNADMVKPLPPINFRNLILHSFKEVEDNENNVQKIPLSQKKYEEMDDYEKELYKIKKSNSYKWVKPVKIRQIYKIYEILPEHVVDLLYKDKNKIIK